MKFSKEANKEVDSLADEAGKAYATLETAITQYNDGLQALNEKLSESVSAFNEAQDALRDYIESERDQFQGEFDDKSEGWQEGERGQAAQDFISAIGEVLGELESIDVELPNAVEVNANNPEELVGSMERESQ